MTRPVDPEAWAKLRRIAPGQLAARRDVGHWRARPLPEELGFKLTHRCDQRCVHCPGWGGGQPDQGQRDLPLDVIARVLDGTRAIRSNVFLLGGEPLLYRDWDGLVELLARHERWTAICTNGTCLERRLDSLVPISARLELSISIDGFAAAHDALRGPGAWDRTVAGLRALVRSKQAGRYLGEITVNCVIGSAVAGQLYELVGFLEREGVETVFLSLPWHISPAAAAAMDAYVAEHLPELASLHPSWHDFGFKLAPECLPRLRAELARIASAKWRVKLRFNPALGPDELAAFAAGSATPAAHKTRCLALATRLDVLPNADVVSCKFFPELVVGNLAQATLAEVWHGVAYDRVRETIATCGLAPVCAKCNLLYSRGA